MKNLSFIALFLATFALSCRTKPFKYTTDQKACTIVSVESFTPGQINSLQTDFVWKAKTDCGMTVTFYREVYVGDTVYIEYRKYKD